MKFFRNYNFLILSSAIFLIADYALAENRSVITNVSVNAANNTLTVTWNQLEPIAECFVELTGSDPNSFYSPPEDPVPCVTAGSKTKIITLNYVQGVVPLYTVIIDNAAGEVISDYVLVRASLPETGTSGGNVSPAPSPLPVPSLLPAPAPSPLPAPVLALPPASVSESKPEPRAKQRIILRNLSLGSTGEEVSTLQELLKSENVYPEGLVTGYFGELTKKAVIRFQEKYSQEILAPLGLSSGTGYVGPATLKKLNLILKNAGADIPVSIFNRDLYEGLSGEDVKQLQLFLQNQGFFPPGLLIFRLEEAFGSFGSSTKAAVIKFQEKYAGEILAPAGLVFGSGFVGPFTRAKIEVLRR